MTIIPDRDDEQLDEAFSLSWVDDHGGVALGYRPGSHADA